MSYRIALNFEDGATRFIECRQGEKVLDAAYRQKINLPMDCADGVCGTCKCRCEQGEYDLGEDYIADALSPDEAAEGLVLTCQMVPSADCIIAVPVPSAACKVTPSTHTATVSILEFASDSTIILKLTLDTPKLLTFLPGQYVNLTVPDTDRYRSYSFSSKPGAADVSFLIRNVPGGLMSTWLTKHAVPGAKMCFTGPNGSFFLRVAERPLLLLAGGTGLAPMLAMLEVLADVGCLHPIHLIYGVSKASDLVEINRLDALAKRLSAFTYISVVGDSASGHPRLGFVNDHLTPEDLHGGNCDVYVCGPPPMVDSVRQQFRTLQLNPANFYYEKFAASEIVLA